ncbi:hypothetical protein SAMN05428970_3792 [Agromyces sp. CF514]|uniref:hypothetical protein n=1 Tax=Agromyces sp. CF514 TaxID=1881031 RepID=UPI0008ED98A6|nr:hypothetical protein [Agromyces sp. CF514]SFR91398.1 hypothetical protein SAMN05428970_3792 [Agromyces sp. CF514]
MSLLRWIPTFLAFPLGGLLAMLAVGSVTDPLTALAAGAIAGAILGGAQWLALGRAVDRRWLVATLLAFGGGAALSAALFGPPAALAAAALTGLVTGLLVGGAQAIALGMRLRVGALWAAVVSLSWAAAWAITSFVIVDLDRGHVVFGSSGAIVATVLTGLALRRILGPRPKLRDAHLSGAQELASKTQPPRQSLTNDLAATEA